MFERVIRKTSSSDSQLTLTTAEFTLALLKSDSGSQIRSNGPQDEPVKPPRIEVMLRLSSNQIQAEESCKDVVQNHLACMRSLGFKL
ncbi:hypothetical protein D9757_010972 [Collybiopsis confluens]|uniref:Uncharacterized protein n=1 Tax=Collybiopsis confluens TaxID=2823264 RepID=A0A8H5GMD3_9AGAR|nr:hypothetical protein D9757_011320 [Collybiopsis confluens]KAF5367666.1 hypothetical protein D9757_010972 [Collybiopsis confluens]